MSYVWLPFGDGVDQNSRVVKEQLLAGNVEGVVLDIGAGHGHTAKYLNRDKVSKYVALEPNELMHPKIREIAQAAGFSEADGTLLILPYGAEQIAAIVSALGGPNAVDTMVSILTLCSVPSPEESLYALLQQVLKPGGQLLFYEHVQSSLDDVAWWQHFWTPVWKRAFDGCCLDRPTHVMIRKMDLWQSGQVWGLDGEPEEHLFWHRVGRFVKKAV